MSKSGGQLIEINPIRVDENTVGILEELLERARSGSIQQVLVVHIDREHVVGTTFSRALEIQAAVFGVKLMELRINELCRRLEDE